MSRLLLIMGIILLLVTEILRVYFIMPFPGSQASDTIDIAYFIEKYKWILRITGMLLIVVPGYRLLTAKKILPKILFAVFAILYCFTFYKFNFRFQADKMFLQPTLKLISDVNGNKIDSNKLVIGIDINGVYRAYPIQIIGYHHQIRDTVNNVDLIVTYCTVCRTGRVYSPLVNGHPETFRLVGMDHYNAMFEDETTKSWWQQATGVAIAGPLKGMQLTEFPSHQATLASWIRLHPQSSILQADSNFREDYNDLADFDKGTIKSHLEKRDSASWKMKSWVVGVKTKGIEKAYDWNDILKDFFIQDSVGKVPVLVVLESDTSTFHVYSRRIQSQTLRFLKDSIDGQLTDINTRSVWNINGVCISGMYKDARLEPIAAYQEFWHAWKQFHPNTTEYKP